MGFLSIGLEGLKKVRADVEVLTLDKVWVAIVNEQRKVWL